MADNFSIFKRTGRPYYYCQFKLADGSYTPAKSTKEKTKGKAREWALQQIKDGNIQTGESVYFKDFAKDFFSWKGEWAKDKVIAGRRVSERQCREKQHLVDTYIVPIIGDKKLHEIDRAVIKEMRNHLFYEKKLSGSTVNKGLSCVKSILESAEEKKLIALVPKIERVSDRPKKTKGVLTIDEAKKIFAVQWVDYRAYALSLTAASTGMRLGELLALKIKHFHGGYIVVERSWDEHLNKLNDTTKTGRMRNVVIPAMVSRAIEKLITLNPYRETLGNDAFIFFSPDNTDRPAHPRYMTDCFYRAMREAKIKEEERKRRNITFHSWRYFLNSVLINAKIPLQKVQSITGHLTDEMSQHYYNSGIDEMEDVRAIQEGIFSGEQGEK